MTRVPVTMPEDVAKVVDYVVEVMGPETYLVGGSVRDTLLGRCCNDFDFTTPLLPEETERRIQAAGRKVYNMGRRFGTLGMTVEGTKVEITTFRQEQYDGSTRTPNVKFVSSLEDDLSRRDFSINALAYDHVNGVVIDVAGGMADLQSGVLRAVGKPRDRFKDDPLRLLRLARFAGQLGFSPEETTLEHALDSAPSIMRVSRERWLMELDKLLLSTLVANGLNVLAKTKVLQYILPEVWLQVGCDQNNPHHALDLWNHTLAVVDFLPAQIELRWAGLLHDVGKPFALREKSTHSTYVTHEVIGAELAARIGYGLRWPKTRVKSVPMLVYTHMDEGSPLREADLRAKKVESAPWLFKQ